MNAPHTVDERERRFVQYCLACNKGELKQVRLAKLNRAANFRRAIRELIEEFVETRAEDLAAAMLEAHAPERQTLVESKAVPANRRRMPVWVQRIGRIENARVTGQL